MKKYTPVSSTGRYGPSFDLLRQAEYYIKTHKRFQGLGAYISERDVQESLAHHIGGN
jgi:hypothetical protein